MVMNNMSVMEHAAMITNPLDSEVSTWMHEVIL